MNTICSGALSLFFLLVCSGFTGGKPPGPHPKPRSSSQPVYRDIPYRQDYSVRYYLPENSQSIGLHALSVNRDAQIRILSDSGLWVPGNGSFLYPGQLTRDVSYRAVFPKKVSGLVTYLEQTVYLDDRQIFSNAWAGKIQIDHGLPGARLMAGGKDFHFLVSDGDSLVYLDQEGHGLWSGSFKGLLQLSYRRANNSFLLVSAEAVAELVPGRPIRELFRGSAITCAAYFDRGRQLAIGTVHGYYLLAHNVLRDHLPCTDIRCIREIDGRLWMGTSRGAFYLDTGGKYRYYAGERWLPDNQVLAMEKGPQNSVLILTKKGLGQIFFTEMTLEDKAMFFERQVREKNIRYGMNCSAVRLTDSYASAETVNQPSDNLWTGMYLAGQLFRYRATGSLQARQNALESFEALERLHTVTGIRGLFARSFERDYKRENALDSGWQIRELQTGSPANLWLSAADHHNWTWRSTASSDQAVGQIFGLTAVLELSGDKAWKARALKCLDDLVGYIVDHNLYLIDVDGQPTLWGKWNPDYVNHFAENIGDRKINSSNIIAFLQTAYHFTGKQKYRTKAFELMDQYGYLHNLMRPMASIGSGDQDTLSKILSEGWNHSDDEMYFLAYWGLYPYAFTPVLQKKFRAAIRDHWSMERPEEDALWNFTYAMTGAQDFDLPASVRFLRNYPLDLRNWAMRNSGRQDINLLPANFRGQTTSELLPLGELPLFRHNGQVFTLDTEGDGKTLISAGDTWLLPYWMGRYLGVISAPVHRKARCRSAP